MWDAVKRDPHARPTRRSSDLEDKKNLHTGSAEGKRTDSMMILHAGDNAPTLISLPRDSNVEIPSFVGSESGKTYPGTGRQVKLNARSEEHTSELQSRENVGCRQAGPTRSPYATLFRSRGQAEPAHRVRRGQAHGLDDDPARR